METLYRITSLFHKDTQGDLWPVDIDIPSARELDDWSSREDQRFSGSWLYSFNVECEEVKPSLDSLPLGSVVLCSGVHYMLVCDEDNAYWVSSSSGSSYRTVELREFFSNAEIVYVPND